MPRYRYTKLTISCGTPRHFAADRLREAVESLRTVPGVDDPAMHIGLIAEAHVTAGQYKLRAIPMFRLSEIVGKTPTQVWEMFDREVDEWRAGLIKGQRGWSPGSFSID